MPRRRGHVAAWAPQSSPRGGVFAWLMYLRQLRAAWMMTACRHAGMPFQHAVTAILALVLESLSPCAWRCHELRVSILNKNQRGRRTADFAADEPGGLGLALRMWAYSLEQPDDFLYVLCQVPPPRLQPEQNTSDLSTTRTPDERHKM